MDDALTTEAFIRWWEETGEHELRQLLLWRVGPDRRRRLLP